MNIKQAELSKQISAQLLQLAVVIEEKPEDTLEHEAAVSMFRSGAKLLNDLLERYAVSKDD